MAILLFTDFGAADVYVGQVELMLDRYATGARVIHLCNEAPAFNVRASAHLLAALAAQVTRGHVVIAVVDPGVGTERKPVVLRADGRWFVGPDNGLLSVVAARSSTRQLWHILPPPGGVSHTFHGRDVFAPTAGAIASDDFPNERVEAAERLEVTLPADDLAEVIYVDHYGNVMTGLRAAGLAREGVLTVHGHRIAYARTYAETPEGATFWYENSVGLVEIARHGASAAQALELRVGTPVAWRA
jgi:hypothetical protein